MSENKYWIVEVPKDIFSVDKDLEDYLNSFPHPGYILDHVILRGGGKDIYVLIWKRIL